MLKLSSVAAGATAIKGTSTGAAQASHERFDDSIESHDGTEIVFTVYKPAEATEKNSVPLIVHSHGWSGSRTSSEDAFQRELDRGFAVLSFDQRGHGESGGQAHVQNPEREGKDVIEILDYITRQAWVARSQSGTQISTPDDPMVFAMGGSYGGGYQLVGAFTEKRIREDGETRFDALAPQITWFDLSESLAPQGVTRSAWVAALYAAGAANIPEYIHRAFVYGSTTGQWPDGELPGEPDIDSQFFENGPSGFVDEMQLDIPVLFGQGTSDNLFNLNQAWHNFEDALTEEAQDRSAVVAYNGGHALPNALPPGQLNFDDACSPDGDFGALRLQFFDAVRTPGSSDSGGQETVRDVVASRYRLTTADGSRCLRRDTLADRTSVASGIDVTLPTAQRDGVGLTALGADRVTEEGDRLVGAMDESVAENLVVTGDGVAGTLQDEGVVGTTTGVGVPLNLELTAGPVTVGGVPLLSAQVTTVGVEQRVFAALAVGETPATAQVVQNNMMPLREPEPVVGESRTIELPGVAIDVADGERLFLTLSAMSDMSFGHGSVRTPGSVILEDLQVEVPLVDE